MDYDQWEMADKWVERLREAYPTHPNLPIMKAEILMGLDRFEEALPMLQDIIEANPYDSEAWNCSLQFFCDCSKTFALLVV